MEVAEPSPDCGDSRVVQAIHHTRRLLTMDRLLSDITRGIAWLSSKSTTVCDYIMRIVPVCTIHKMQRMQWCSAAKRLPLQYNKIALTTFKVRGRSISTWRISVALSTRLLSLTTSLAETDFVRRSYIATQ